MEVGKLLSSLFFPEAEVKNSRWASIWNEQKNSAFKKTALLAFFISSLTYILHYFFVDTPLGLTTKSDYWFYYRFGLATFNLFGFLFCLFLKRDLKFNLTNIVFIFDGLLICYFQSRSIIWYSGVPYFWGILFAILYSTFANLSVVSSLLYCLVLLGVQYGNLIEAGININLSAGAFGVAFFLVLFFKSKTKHQIKSFIANYEILTLQEKVIESHKTLNEQIQAFLPKKIKERLASEIQNNQSSVVQAVDEVLRPREREIAALFSDIRGFTQGSKNSHYISDSVIPNIKNTTEIIEAKEGIPRLIGDLVFSYFDDVDNKKNILHSFKAAIDIIYDNHTHNLEKPIELYIKRHVLLDTGRAVVGNIGSVSSAREITALGNCVNRLSRIDLWTKGDQVKNVLGFNSVVVSRDYYELLKIVFPEISLERITLLTGELKDFPEETELFIFNGDKMFQQIDVNLEAA